MFAGKTQEMESTSHFMRTASAPSIGTELFAIPTHVCPTSALYPAVPVVENGKVTGWWKVAARDRRLTL